MELILEQFVKEKNEMPLRNCWLQCYDNTAIMVDYKKDGWQRINVKNCSNHSPNLVRVHVANHDILMVMFCHAIQSLYSFHAQLFVGKSCKMPHQ